jgi:hypothetical protein
MDTEGSFAGDKLPEREDDHSLSFSAELSIRATVPPLPHASSWHGV